MNFDQYVSGRSIALIGPGPIDGDHSADVDAHDLVYRLGLYDKYAPGTGTRTDMVQLNGRQGRIGTQDPDNPELAIAHDATWWIWKGKHQSRPHPGQGRIAITPRMTNPNQATLALFDLNHYDTGPISVYGVDLYSGGPEDDYNPTYGCYDMFTLGERARAFLGHRPIEQLKVHRAIVERGKVIGNDRYLAAATQTDEEYKAVIARWQAAYDTAKQADPALT